MLAAMLTSMVFALALGAASPRLTVAVAPFTAVEPAAAFAAEGLAHALTERLYEVPSMNVVSVRQVSAALRAMGESGGLETPGAAERLSRAVGVDRLVTGRLDRARGELRLQWFVFGDERANRAATVKAEKGAPMMTGLERAAATTLASWLALPDEGGARAAFVGAMTTASDPAWLALFEAVALLGPQSLSPRSASQSTPPALDAKARAIVRGLLGKALATDRTLRSAHSCLAVIEALEGNDKAAGTELGAAAGGPQPMTTLAAAFVHMREANAELAARAYSDAIAARPGFLHARGSLGQLYNHVGRFREAAAVFRAYAQAAPRQPWALAQLGYTLARQKKHDEARAVTEQALALDPTSTALQTELASRAIDAGRFDDAAAVLGKVLAAWPQDGKALVRASYVELLRGGDEQAVVLGKRALAVIDATRERQDAMYAQVNLARAYGHKGDLDAAVAALAAAKALGLHSGDELVADAKLAQLVADPRYRALGL